MKYLILIFTILISSILLCQNNNDFSLQGKTQGLVDGTLLLFQNSLTNKFIDSFEVKNNSFNINTELTIFPSKLLLWKDSTTAKNIWVENKKMTFDAVSTNFEDAIITGSITDSIATSHKNKVTKLKTYEEMLAAELEFIINNPDNILSAHNLSIMAPVFGKEKSIVLFDSFSINNKQSDYGKKIAKYLDLELAETLKIGEKYVDFSMKNTEGEEAKLSELDGKVILLEFWASWCSPCRKENPELIKTYEKFKNNGFEIFAVSLDSKKENWLNAIEEDKLEWKHVSDLKGRDNLAALIYQVGSIPDNFLINKKGIVIGRNLKREQLIKKLQEILEVPDVIIGKEENSINFRINDSMIWQDENGIKLKQAEVKKLLDTNLYTPHLNTEKNIMVLKKD